MNREIYTFLDLYKRYSLYIKDFNELERIERAYIFAKAKHKGQIRKSGEDYITHPLSVSYILAKLNVSPEMIIAGLLHDVVEDTSVTLQDIEKNFGQDVSQLVDGLTKINKLSFDSLKTKQIENHQKLLLAMGKDIRVIVIKLCDRLHNIRTIEYQSEEKKQIICKETLDIFVPLASRLGIFRIKAELEDYCLKYLDKNMYDHIIDCLEKSVPARINNIHFVIDQISKYLDEDGISPFKIKGRVKNIYSIYKKMINQNKEFSDIYDILAVRIIVEDISDCYKTLGIIHAHYTPIPKRFKDYISVPKPNMYQSLHTTVLSESKITFEVQIRTKEMDKIAEYGVAAHWAYKDGVSYSKEKIQFEIASKLKWYGDLIKYSENKEKDAFSFVDSVKNDILTTSVYVYTPKGDVYDLPIGATPIDLAYKIHSQLGNTLTGAKVNRKIVPIDYKLQNGDLIFIITNKNSSGPTLKWLNLCKTTNAKHKIKAFINVKNKDLLIEDGKKITEEEFRLNKININLLTETFIKDNFSKNNINSLEDLYLNIAKGIFSVKTLLSKIKSLTEKETFSIIEKNTSKKINKHFGIKVSGLKNPKIKLAVCCRPCFGDDIIGYVSKIDGIVVHRNICKNVLMLDKERRINVTWIDENITYQSRVICKSSKNIIQELISLLAKNNIVINSFSNKIIKDLYNFKLDLEVKNKNQLDNLILLISNIEKVESCYRDNASCYSKS